MAVAMSEKRVETVSVLVDILWISLFYIQRIFTI